MLQVSASVLGRRSAFDDGCRVKRQKPRARRDLLYILPKDLWCMILQFLPWGDWSSLVSLLPESIKMDPCSWSTFSTRDHACAYFHGFPAPFSKLILNKLTNIELERHSYCDTETVPHTIFPGMLYHAHSVRTLRMADVYTKLEAIPFVDDYQHLTSLSMSRLIQVTEEGIANFLAHVPALQTLTLEGHRNVPVTGDVFMPPLVASARSLKEARFFENLSPAAIDLLFTLQELETVVLSCASMAGVTCNSKHGSGTLTKSLKSVRFEDCSQLSEQAILLLLQTNRGLESLLTQGLVLTPAIANAIHGMPNLRTIELYRCSGLNDQIASILVHGLPSEASDSETERSSAPPTPTPSSAPSPSSSSSSSSSSSPSPSIDTVRSYESKIESILSTVPRWTSFACFGGALTGAGIHELSQSTQHLQLFDCTPSTWPADSSAPASSGASVIHRLSISQTRQELSLSSDDIIKIAASLGRAADGSSPVQEVTVSGVSLRFLQPNSYPVQWLNIALKHFNPLVRFSVVDYTRSVEFRYFPAKQSWLYRQLGKQPIPGALADPGTPVYPDAPEAAEAPNA